MSPQFRNAGIANVEPCQCCGEATRKFLRVRRHTYLRCVACGYLKLSQAFAPAEIVAFYGDSYFTGGGAGYADYYGEADLLRERGRYYGAILNRFSPPATVLDVGCAAGFLLKGLCDAGWRGSGIDPNAHAVTYGQRTLNLDVQMETLETFRGGQTFDAITMVQVAEHVYDLERALENARNLCNANGLWLIETGNAASFTARLLGGQWHELSPPTVLRIFTPYGLKRLAERYGFKPIAQGRPRKSILAAHAKTLLTYKAEDGALMRLFSSVAQLLPDRARIPYPAEDTFWLVLRKVA